MNTKTRPLTLAEYQSLIRHSPEPWSYIFQIAFITALRLGDLVDLTFDNIGDQITVVEQKTGKLKSIPIGPALRGCVDYFSSPSTRDRFHKQYSKGRIIHLLPFSDHSAYRKALVRCASYAMIPLERLAFHSLRKTAATMIAQNLGVIAASQYLNHSKLSTTMLYIEEDSIKVQNLLEAEAMLSLRVQ